MKQSEVRKALETGFKVKFGNTLKKHKYVLIKHFGEIYFDFGVGIVDYDNSFPSTFYFGFGNKIYSNLFNKMINQFGLNIQGNKFFIAIGTGQLRLFKEGKYPILEYDICTQADAQKMVDEVSTYILNEVLPEWEANPTLEYLEKKVNEKLTDVPSFSGLILAKLVGNPKYESIKQHFTNVSQDWGDWDKKDLEKVIEFLDNHNREELLQIAETPT